MSPKDLEDLTNALYDEGLSDDEVHAELSKLDDAPAAPLPAATAGKPGLLSPETLAPATMAAFKAGPQAGDSAMVQSQLDLQKEAPAAFNMAPGGMGMPTPIVSSQSMQAGLGAVGDWLGKGFRLAGSLIPSRVTRGSTEDATAPMGKRTRTFTESMQNPEGSIMTGLGEDIQDSNAPTAVKVIGKTLLGAGEGGIAAGAAGAANQTVKTLLARGLVPAANMAEGAAKYVQNVRMGTNTADIAKGASAGNAMKHGLGNKTLKNALPIANEKIDAWSKIRDAIYKKKAERGISASDALHEVQENIVGKEFGRSEKTAALDEIRTELWSLVNRKPGAFKGQGGFTPRRPISQLTQNEIQAGVKDGSIKFNGGKSGIGFEYSKPEVPPDLFAPTGPGVHLTLEEADHFKQWLQDAGARFGKGSPRESGMSEQVYKDAYAAIARKAEHFGGEEYAKMNKNLSELLPIRDVIKRTLKRGELGSDVVDKMGAIKATANAAASVTGLNRQGATAVYDAAQGIKEAAKVPLREAAGQGAAEGFRSGLLRGSLLGAGR